MGYIRVIPRDLFNEASLLKCYGQIYLNLESMPGHDAELGDPPAGEPFRVQFDESDGSISLTDVMLRIGKRRASLKRPMNSRDPYPLYVQLDDDSEEIAVFNDDGSFSSEMIELLTKEGK